MKFSGLNFDTLEKLSKDEQKKVVGGYGSNCPGYTLSGCLSQGGGGVTCYYQGQIQSGSVCCYSLC